MQLCLRPIDRSNYNDCIRLKVREDQEGFVATNAYSLVQAAYEPRLYPLGIYDDDKMVGFILYDYDEDIPGWSMSRFMIDVAFQGQGYGKKALREFIRLFKEQYPTVQQLYTSAEVNNSLAISMYEKAGFVKGEVITYDVYGEIHREVRMVLSLQMLTEHIQDTDGDIL